MGPHVTKEMRGALAGLVVVCLVACAHAADVSLLDTPASLEPGSIPAVRVEQMERYSQAKIDVAKAKKELSDALDWRNIANNKMTDSEDDGGEAKLQEHVMAADAVAQARRGQSAYKDWRKLERIKAKAETALAHTKQGSVFGKGDESGRAQAVLQNRIKNREIIRGMLRQYKQGLAWAKTNKQLETNDLFSRHTRLEAELDKAGMPVAHFKSTRELRYHLDADKPGGQDLWHSDLLAQEAHKLRHAK